jgi:hypothetical protein
MNKIFFILIIISFNLITKAQNVIPIIIPSIPYENYYTINDFPKSNEKISFTLPNPFVDFKDSVLDKHTTYQHLINLPLVTDSLFTEYIKYAMLSLNYEQKFCNVKKGAEIWYGMSKGNIPTMAGIYFKNSSDSTRLYVLTTFSLTFFDKKSKTDISKMICDRIKLIMDITQKKKKY